jgi:preprotein translocase subunit SecY
MLETLRNAWKIEDIRKKIIFTLFILALTRVGSAIPVPFLDPSILSEMVASTGGMFSYLDILSGGAFSQSTLFALSISPYITASIVMQLLTVAIPYLEALAKEGEEGKKKIAKITRYTTLGLALLQSYAYMTLLNARGAIFDYQGWQYFFVRIIIVACFTAGAMLIVFLGERIDVGGIGNGISMVLFISIVSRGPAVIRSMLAYWGIAMDGQTYYFFAVPLVAVLFLLLIAFIVLMTNAERRIPIQYAKRIVGRKQYGGQSTFLPIKVNMSGVLPVIFASTLLAVPTTIRDFAGIGNEGFLGKALSVFNFDTGWYGILYFMLVIAFNYFYVAVQYNPIEISNNLRKNSGTVPGIRPGKPTSDYISRIVSKTTFLGGMFLGLVATMPIVAGSITKMNISLGGTTIIILVGVALDTVRQLESQMMMRHYKGFLE